MILQFRLNRDLLKSKSLKRENAKRAQSAEMDNRCVLSMAFVRKRLARGETSRIVMAMGQGP